MLGEVEGEDDGKINEIEGDTLDGKFDGLIECCAVGDGVGNSDTEERMLGEVEGKNDVEINENEGEMLGKLLGV